MGRLQDKVALVTGAASGIGAGIARAFAAEGATVWLTDIDEVGGRKLADDLGPPHRFAKLDVAVEADWGIVDELVATEGKLDILVNNAGITGFEFGPQPHDPEHASLDEWHRVHAVNLDGTFLGCRAAIRAMRPQGKGAVVNISSRSGLVGIPRAAAYASSKAAIRNHSKSVALYCASEGLEIRCNSVHPAAIMTPIWEAMIGNGPDREERIAKLVADTPVRRFGTVRATNS
ncbi:MAG TPA: SDR family oxidoreductase [Sphingomicrobium sp.]|jgi:NAD(P)-dependent dehydrogenase (short-subunit alcohol dehydrogenase family)